MALPSLFRFLAAFFGSTFLTCAGGSIADLWSPLEAKFSLPFMMITAYAGAMLGPVISAYMGESPVISWRWVDWTMPIFAVVVMALVLLFQPEAYEPFLLSWKAAQFRKSRETTDSRPSRKRRKTLLCGIVFGPTSIDHSFSHTPNRSSCCLPCI